MKSEYRILKLYRFYLKMKDKIIYMACLRSLCWSLGGWRMLRKLPVGDLRSISKTSGHNML